MMRPFRLAALAVVALLMGAAAVYAFYSFSAPSTGTSSCGSNYMSGRPIVSDLRSTSFGHLTEFDLPGNSREPNAIAVAPDSSVWFGEEALPALAHLFQNGTLLEYVWPGTYPPPGAVDYSCGYRTQIWGVALWNGSVWASDASGNQLVSLNPGTGRFHFFSLAASSTFPYYLVAGPDGGLWFTELAAPAIGRLDRNGSARVYPLPTGLFGTPTQIYFVNSTLGLYSDAGQAGANNGGVYQFSPQHPSFTRVGGSRHLSGVTGLAPTPSGFWISEHGPPYVEFYNYTSSSWTNYPTSSVSYASTTLPYFTRSDGVHVWFNEHYGDRIADIDAAHQSMVEYAISSPPAGNLSSITAAQTIARDGAKIWFTELGANRVSFADFSGPPPFALTPLASQAVSLKAGGQAMLSFQLRGNSSSPVVLKFTDSENQTGIPSNLNATSSSYQFSDLSASPTFTLTLKAGAQLVPGPYVFDVTATDGSVAYTLFLHVTVD